MKIAVNAMNLASAGGLTVALNFIQAIRTHYHQVSLHVLAPADVGYEELSGENVVIQTLPRQSRSLLTRLRLDHLWAPKQIERVQPDAIFTMGNFAIPSRIPQGVLFMWPYAAYPNDKTIWSRMSTRDRLQRRLKIGLFRRRLKYASVVFPQTTTSADRLQTYYGTRIRKIKVIPTAYSQIGEGSCESYAGDFRKLGHKHLLCLTQYYPHKNLETLLEVAEQIQSAGSPIRIITTVAANQHQGAAHFLNQIKSRNLEDVLLNLGPVPITQVRNLYTHVEGLILPTLLESYSATYADCLAAGVPVFTSDRDFARDACGDSAIYFDPLQAADIFKTIQRYVFDDRVLQDFVDRGTIRAKNSPNWKTVAGQYVDALASCSHK